MRILDNIWCPTAEFEFPAPVKAGKGSINTGHFKRYNWLVWSKKLTGCLCLPCILFAPDATGWGGGYRSLVKEPLTRFDKLTGSGGYLSTHDDRQYHKDSQAALDIFERNRTTPDQEIRSQLQTKHAADVAENRARLLPVIKTIELCARSNIALRGHRDDGPLALTDTAAQEGNFRRLLRYRVDGGDKKLEEQLNNPANATYISKTTQNEIIHLQGQQILDQISKRVAGSPYFSVIADETPDTSGMEQLSVSVRYVYDGKLREDFLCFTTVEDQTAQTLASHILTALQLAGLDLEYLVGQGYDGAANMSGQFRGVQAHIHEKYPKAIYMHCSAHVLNLVLGKCCKQPSIRYAFSVLHSTEKFINNSTRRSAMFKTIVEEVAPASKKTKLASLSETRWAARHDATDSFIALYKPVVYFLETTTSDDRLPQDTKDKARDLFRKVTSSEFLDALCILADILGITFGLSCHLQEESLDIAGANQIIDSTKEQLSEKIGLAQDPTMADSLFFAQAKELAAICDIQLQPPNRMRREGDWTRQTAAEYYLEKVYLPFLRDVTEQIELRYGDHWVKIRHLSAIIPIKVDATRFEDLTTSTAMYEQCLPQLREKQLKVEFNSWKSMWANSERKPSTALEALDQCSASRFPNIRQLLKIFITLPVSTATAERSFSSMKLIKTYLRSMMVEGRLNGLALMYIHQDISINNDALA